VRLHAVVVEGLAPWLDASRLLGDGEFQFSAQPDGSRQAEAHLDTARAADLGARLRNVAIGGWPVVVRITPSLSRDAVRAARLEEARRRRDGTPGFLRRGTRLDAEGRISLSPEPLADAFAAELAASGARTVLDVCAGAGGDAIACARHGLRVVAVERDAARLALLAHNARVYGVDARITLVHGDAVEVVRRRAADVVYVDPPWGAAYDRRSVTMADVSPLAEVWQALCDAPTRPRFVAKLPPSFDVRHTAGAIATAVFGEAPGDWRRVKMLRVTLPVPRPPTLDDTEGVGYTAAPFEGLGA
jgi:hypothetical protein